MNWLQTFYCWFWFNTEWYLTPVNRRPYTFIMRDWLFRHVTTFVVILIVCFGLIFWFNLYHPLPASIIGFFSAGLLAHLVWGSKWIEGEQEYPEYLGEI